MFGSITRAQQGSAVSTVLHKSTYFVFLKKKMISSFLCCCGRIEIKYLFSWLFLNTPPSLGVKMLLGIQIKAATNASAFLFQHFSTSEAILQQTYFLITANLLMHQNFINTPCKKIYVDGTHRINNVTSLCRYFSV